MIVVFLVDSSASMNQKFSNGMSALECTKSGIEHLLKHLPQVKPADKHNDKFMLVTYEEGLGCIKSSFKDPLPHLIKELKVLKAHDMSSPTAPLSTIFNALNVYRVYHGIDTPASVNLPVCHSAGVDYYTDPFRWDQRMYTIFLEPIADVVDQQLSSLSTTMGGTSYRVRTLRHMLQAMDCMLGISKILPTQNSPQPVLHIYGVVVNFVDLIDDQRRPPITANHHQLVYINPSWLNPSTRHAGFFPIPEPFWPETDAQRIPKREAQPTLHYHTREERSVDIPEGFPYDKYVVSPCPMTQELLTRPPGSCWPVYIKNSYRTEGFGFPFGFLKANTHKNAVTLTVVAYNYPALFTLLVNLNSIPGRTPTAQWLRDFAEYLSHTPTYYYAPLRAALKRIGLSNIVPSDQGGLSSGIQRTLIANKAQVRLEGIKVDSIKYDKKLTCVWVICVPLQAKIELDRLQTRESSAAVESLVSKRRTQCTNAFDVPRAELISVLGDLKNCFFKELQFTSPASNTSLSITSPKPKSDVRTGTVFSRMDALVDSDELHSLPIADMGIYQDRMQKMQQETLRDPFRDEESAKSLQRTMFGNPYKQDKKVSIDEEDEAPVADSSVSSNSSSGGSTWSSILGRRRKPRWRSVSPPHFPIERIPSLAHGDRSVSGKVQVLSLGPSGEKAAAAPLLRIMVKDGSGKATSTDEVPESLGRHMVMHDGEDQDEDDEDFRRAMYNSDEMELDGDDETARLRADTPMPGGIGLDDDDEDMEDMQHAQDLIPPPIMPVSLDDIAAGAAAPYHHHKESSVANLSEDMEYIDRQDISKDQARLSESTKPVFESLVYDPSALMELQSIPTTIPEHQPTEPASSLSLIGAITSSTPSPKDEDINHKRPSNGDSASYNLMPIPILQAPSTQIVPTPLPTSKSALPESASSEKVMVPPAASSTYIEAQSSTSSSSLSKGALISAATSQIPGQTGVSGASHGQHSAGDFSASLEPELMLNSTVLSSHVPDRPNARLQPHELSEAGSLELDTLASAINSMNSRRRRTDRQTVAEVTLLQLKDSLTEQLLQHPRAYNSQVIVDIVRKVEMAPNWTKEQKSAALMACFTIAKGLRRESAVISALSNTLSVALYSGQ
ncbi:Integrator complex subunit 6 [Mortierella sp. GBA30]|nr:Integrator complex subunit 6 [Mortierella sp. GBA30]